MSVLAYDVSPPARAYGVSHLHPFKFLSAGQTDPGRVRSLNEDAFLNRPDIGLWAVSDGMGGHKGGDMASQMTVDALSGVELFGSAYAFRNAACQALKGVNADLQAYASGSGPSGATVVALLAHKGHYACLWAGDSRAYLYREGLLQRVTRDHSYVQDLIDRGLMTQSEARNHPAANVITRAVGATPSLELDCAHGALRAGDRFVLCSDGLTGMLSDREIAQFIQRPPLEGALERMIECALRRGAPDNVTAVLVAVETARARDRQAASALQQKPGP